jgi:DNA-binding response OmpR family regulator
MTKIMVVDDDIETTTVLASILKLEGYEPISVNDSTVAIQKANSLLPDLFLLDLMMPVIDGFKLCRLLRENPRFMSTPIIIITALDNTDSRIVSFGAGANDFIAKPYLPHELILKVKEQLKG